MSATPREWQYLERRPGSSYQQLCIKGKRIWAWTLYCEFMNEKEPRTPEELAEDWGVPLEAVHEAIAYCQSVPRNSKRTVRRISFWLRRSAWMSRRSCAAAGRVRYRRTSA